jgi:hypothetical protein
MEQQALVRDKMAMVEYALCEDVKSATAKVRALKVPLVNADWIVECIRTNMLIDPRLHQSKFIWLSGN